MPRWACICQLCWEVCNNDQYWPDEPRAGYVEGCDACGDELALSVNVHPDIVEETRKTLLTEANAPWCLHCGSDTCQHINQHNAAYGRAS